MVHYRAYAVRFDGNFDGYESLNCADDDQASAAPHASPATAPSSFGPVSASLPGWNRSRVKRTAASSKLHESGPRQLVNSVILPLPAQASHIIG